MNQMHDSWSNAFIIEIKVDDDKYRTESWKVTTF